MWVRGDVATPGGLPRRTEEDDYGRVDLDDDEGRTVLTLYVERTAEGYTLHVENPDRLAADRGRPRRGCGGGAQLDLTTLFPPTVLLELQPNQEEP